LDRELESVWDSASALGSELESGLELVWGWDLELASESAMALELG
jgi:hypothetical protein